MTPWLWADLLEETADPGWLYCPVCNDIDAWRFAEPNCPPEGLCRGRALLPVPTTRPRPVMQP